MSFHVGQKVVCVDDSPHPSEEMFTLEGSLEKGSTYVIRTIVEHPLSARMGLQVTGVRVFLVGRSEEWFHCSDRFRPLEELQQESKERYYAEHPIHA